MSSVDALRTSIAGYSNPTVELTALSTGTPALPRIDCLTASPDAKPLGHVSQHTSDSIQTTALEMSTWTAMTPISGRSTSSELLRSRALSSGKSVSESVCCCRWLPVICSTTHSLNARTLRLQVPKVLLLPPLGTYTNLVTRYD